MFKILVVEDDKKLNQAICSFLERIGYETTGCLETNDDYNAMYGEAFGGVIRYRLRNQYEGWQAYF